ncbi:MAG: hypothetical protein JWO30_310 [Fibrobacteres bacterium]|nr:hypothetical protein [Fibrobacterota bacterium]
MGYPETSAKLKFHLGITLLCLCCLSAQGTALAQTSYEAESAALSGGANISTEHAGYSGTGYVQGYDAGKVGAATAFTVSAATAGFYDITLRYANGYGASSLSIYVNQVKVLVSELPATGAWTTLGNKTETLALIAGNNTITYKYDTGDGARVNLDKVTVGATTQSKPDLIVTDLFWTPIAPAEGSAITLKAVLRNTGTGPTPAGEQVVSFRAGGLEVAKAVRTAPLAAGASDTLTGDAAWSAAHGAYTLTAAADPANSIAELNETNNSISKSITLTQKQGPDLIVQSITWTPFNPPAGSPVAFSVIVQNQGTEAGSGSPAVSLQINAGAPLSGSSTGAIAAGGSSVIAISGTWTAVNGANTVTATVDPQNLVPEAVETNNSLRQSLYIGRGAQVPWIEYEAEDGKVTGGAAIVGPSRILGTPAGEASGRKAVMLDQANASVEWNAMAAANSIVVRVCIPDAPSGGGIKATLGLYINGVHKDDIAISSEHSWLYGNDDQQADAPGPGARKIYSEAHLLFKGYAINTGDKVMLRKDAASTAAYYAVDLIDLEQVAPPLAKPDGFISITEAGHEWPAAIPDDGIADDNAINQCIAAAQAGKYKGVFLPPGTFQQDQKIMTTHVKMQGAGMWHSTLYCPNKNEDAGWGNTGFNVNGDSCEFRDFAIFGWGGTRTQGGKAFVNSAHLDMVIERLWIENVQCGYWVGGNQQSTNLMVKDTRIRNTGADGINLCNGSLNGTIQNCHARNTGDDAFAIWSATDLWPHPCTNNTIRNCTVQVTWRAACFAIYGGSGNKIQNCVGSEALTYPGLTVSSEFSPYPMQSATVDGLTLYRCGGHYFTGFPWEGDFGAIWVRADQSPTDNITIRNVDVIDPTFQGISMQGTGTLSNTLLEEINISNPTNYAIQIKAGLQGKATFRHVNLISNQYNVPRMLNSATALTLTEVVSVYNPKAVAQHLRARFSQVGRKVSIDFTVPAGAGSGGEPVKISVFQMDGKRLAFLENRYPAGAHRVELDAGTVGPLSGFGIVTVESGREKEFFSTLFR